MTIIIICSILSGQNYFNRAIGNRVSSISAKSASMGGVGFINNQTSSISIINPAYIMYTKGLKADINYNNLYYSDDRSFASVDYFGDYFADLTYVTNSQSQTMHNMGITYVNNNFGISASTGPFFSTDYNYTEEVWNINDDLAGYFQLTTSGIITCNSYGFGASLDESIHIGLSINQLLQTKLQYYKNDNQDIIDISSSFTSYNDFTTFSIWILPTNDIELAIGFEENSRIKYTSLLTMEMDKDIGLPLYDTSSVMLQNEFYKPSFTRIGFSHHSNQIKSHTLSVEYEKATYSDSEIDSTRLRDVHTLGVGVEYEIYNFPPFRVGLTYSTSPFRKDLSKTIFSFGTGWVYRKFNIDAGCRYWHVSYPYRDIFPVIGDTSNPFGIDIVKENNLDILLTIQYQIY